MRLLRSKSANACSYYMIESYRDEKGLSKTRKVENLGTAKSIMEKYHVDDPEQWCKEYIAKKNEELKLIKNASTRTVKVEFKEDNLKASESSIYNAGSLILDAVYHSFGINNICDEIQSRHPHIKGFSLDNVLKNILFGRIISPSSKLGIVNSVQHKFINTENVDTQHLYRAMDLLVEENDLIQNRLYYYSTQSFSRNVNNIYYDCTNFFTEIEQEDCTIKDKSDEWYTEHTLRKYGKSKENRPNPIVQMGLFMDGNGIPLSFCINPGNTNEQQTMIPLEKKMLNDFSNSDVIVCTDCGLSSYPNRKFNNLTEDNPCVKLGLVGSRHYICTQSIKKLTTNLKEWALDTKGWSYRKFDAQKQKEVLVTNIDISTIDNDKENFYEVIFFKERTTAEKQLDERLIVTFSLKYRDYLRSLRDRKIDRAEKMIRSGSYTAENPNNPRSLIETTYSTENGEVANKISASIDTDKIAKDALFDGFYAISTNLNAKEYPVQKITAINSRRWEIEECFRIMKTSLKSRPFYHNKDSRIKAHFLTCFLALVLCRGIEQKLATYAKTQDLAYPYSMHTMDDILYALRSLNVICIGDGKGYLPDYKDSNVITDLLEAFNLKELSHEIVMKDNIKKILKRIKESPKMIKIKNRKV